VRFLPLSFCSDIDECAKGEDDCHRDAICVNTIGSFSCVCRAGFQDFKDGRLCLNEDEGKLYTQAFILEDYTRKNAQVVTSLPTSRQQDVFALLVTSCQQVWNNLLATCNNLVEITRLVARLF
jgi:hypothetical protein